MALIRGKEVQESPTQYPANPKLWNSITTQAKTKFAKYPSPAAAHWVHTRYVQLGGRFVDKKSQVDPRFRDYAQEKIDKQEELAKKKVTKPIGKNISKGEHFRR
jgi:hypothetical protein